MAVLRPHLALNVTDVERSIPFYRALFAAEPTKVELGYAKFEIEDPALNLTLNEGPRPQAGALNHVGIQVSSTDDVLAARLRLKREGLAPREEMKTSCCYALQDKIWIQDPDGTPWEIFTTHHDLEAAGEKNAACC